MLFFVAVGAAEPCLPRVLESLGGEERWSAGAYTIRGRFSEQGLAGTFVQFEGPLGVKLVRTFDYGVTLESFMAGAAPRERWLVEPTAEVEAGEDGVCRWELEAEPPVQLRVEGGLPVHREGALCNGIPFEIDAQDWHLVDGARFPHSLFAQPRGGPLYSSYSVESVERGAPESAFQPVSNRFVEAWPDQPVPFEVRDDRPHVEVVLTGPSGTRRGWMMLDTGWTTTALRREVAVELGLQTTGFESHTRDAAGRTFYQERAVLDGMDVGGGRWASLPVDIVGALDGSDRLGILGISAFQGQRLEIRGADRVLTWREADADTPPIPGSNCGNLRVDATVGDLTGPFIIDSGAFLTLLYAPSNDARDAMAERMGGGEPLGILVASGAASARAAGPTEISLAGHHLRDAGAAVTTHRAGDAAGLLGWSTLQCFDVTLDLREHRAGFELIGDPDTCASVVFPGRSIGAHLCNLLGLGLCVALPIGLIPVAILRRRRLDRIYRGEL